MLKIKLLENVYFEISKITSAQFKLDFKIQADYSPRYCNKFDMVT